MMFLLLMVIGVVIIVIAFQLINWYRKKHNFEIPLGVVIGAVIVLIGFYPIYWYRILINWYKKSAISDTNDINGQYWQ